jgi:hypothetical protein
MAAAQQATPLVTIAPAPPGAAQLAAWQRLWQLLLGPDATASHRGDSTRVLEGGEASEVPSTPPKSNPDSGQTGTAAGSCARATLPEVMQPT